MTRLKLLVIDKLCMFSNLLKLFLKIGVGRKVKILKSAPEMLDSQQRFDMFVRTDAKPSGVRLHGS